jgi:hypothetical protein
MPKLTQLYEPCLADPLQNGTILEHYIAGEQIDPGKVVNFDPTGVVRVADAAVAGRHTPAGLSLQKMKQPRQTVPVVKHGLVAGFDLTNLAYGAIVFLDTTGDLADAPNATTSVPIAKVVPSTRPNADGTLQKLLEVFIYPTVTY